MKTKTKILLLLLTVITPPIFVDAQIKVTTQNKIGFGTTSPIATSMITVGLDGSSNALSFFQAANGGTPFSLYRNLDYGYVVRSENPLIGMRIDNVGRILFRTTDVVGGAHQIESQVGHSNQYTWTVTRAGSIQFTVKGDGAVQYKSLVSISDERMKENITDINKTETVDKLSKLRSVSYFLKDDAGFGSTGELDSISQIAKQEKITKIKNFGFLAQEVESVFPELVSTNESDIKGINYVGFIPLLVNAIQEQQTTINDLQTEIAILKATKSTTKSGSEAATIQADENIKTTAYLEQNTPNPFNMSTTIQMYIPEGISESYLYIYDLNGTQKDEFTITQRGESSLIIEANTLVPGMYLYSLICDGKLVSTKQMIVTQ